MYCIFYMVVFNIEHSVGYSCTKAETYISVPVWDTVQNSSAVEKYSPFRTRPLLACRISATTESTPCMHAVAFCCVVTLGETNAPFRSARVQTTASPMSVNSRSLIKSFSLICAESYDGVPHLEMS